MAELRPDNDHIIPAEDQWSDEDEGAEVSSSGTSLTSITSSVLQGKMEDGRLYAVYGKQEYGLPMDDQELDRIDMCHAKYYALLEKKRGPGAYATLVFVLV
ncbi:hypothetical protein VTK26DRAFT_1832 [Humicola hyalothermophila]